MQDLYFKKSVIKLCLSNWGLGSNHDHPGQLPNPVLYIAAAGKTEAGRQDWTRQHSEHALHRFRSAELISKLESCYGKWIQSLAQAELEDARRRWFYSGSPILCQALCPYNNYRTPSQNHTDQHTREGLLCPWWPGLSPKVSTKYENNVEKSENPTQVPVNWYLLTFSFTLSLTFLRTNATYFL